jgi:hypothetical protein
MSDLYNGLHELVRQDNDRLRKENEELKALLCELPDLVEALAIMNLDTGIVHDKDCRIGQTKKLDDCNCHVMAKSKLRNLLIKIKNFHLVADEN